MGRDSPPSPALTSADLHLPVSARRFCAIDFESAGAARGRTDAPVQIGLATWTPADLSRDTFVSYLRVDQEIHWSAARVHGITAADLTDAPALAMLWPEIRRRMDSAVVVAHGKGTEKRFLRAFPGHRFGPWIDTLLLARAAWPELPDHSLGALCEALVLGDAVRALVPEKSWHDALFDAAASLVLLEHLIESYQLWGMPTAALVAPDVREWHHWRRTH